MTSVFDVLGPLPAQTTLLEASAGTGKTYTIAALATRYVAEGAASIDEMLLITFGRAATRELRERVREALTSARDCLRDDRPNGDPVVAGLLALAAGPRAQALERLSRAVAEFDAGTIATTHQFCMHALQGLGLYADTDPGEVFAENIGDLIDEVVDDFYVRKYAGSDEAERIGYEQARSLARDAVGDPQADLDAGPVAADSLQASRVSFAKAVRAEVMRRRRQRRLVTFDDLVLRLRDALLDPVSGPIACQRLRDNYRVVLVDEFQDTDPAQWAILRQAFHGHRTLILIGDPKQAIYAFRGADIFSYLGAAAQAHLHATLGTNWRSDQAVVAGVEALMGGLHLGDQHIVVRPVNAAHTAPRLTGLDRAARARLRTICPEQAPAVPDARREVARDVAADVVDLLGGPARLQDRPVTPGDIAVLVTTHTQATLVRDALGDAGVPVVLTSASSVFGTSAADQWQALLKAMQRPRASLLRDAALTDFFGYTAGDLAIRGDEVDVAVASTVREWAHLLDSASVAEMMAAAERDSGLAPRVLGRPHGERDLTDLRHIGNALHAQQRRTGAGAVGLSDWLSDQIRRAGQNQRETTSELTRRLETDAAAVQVLTVHSSKGLEFPVVYVPFAWDRGTPRESASIRCHDASGRRVLDVRGENATGRSALIAARDTEDAGENLRLMYVALTRASSLLVVHWSSSKANTANSALHRSLCAKARGDVAPKPKYPVDSAPEPASPWLDVEQVGAIPSRTWTPPASAVPQLRVAAFTREIDTAWRRTSYSGLTRAAHEAERKPGGYRDDEPDEAVADEGAAPIGEMASPLPAQPAGAAFGTLVHSVLEAVDTSAADLAQELVSCSAQALLRYPVADLSALSLGRSLLPVMRTPLGPLGGHLSLADIPPGDRLAELDVELPMGTGGTATLSAIADLLVDHLPDDDPLHAYPGRMAAAGLSNAELRGYLTGSIDAVLRVPGQRFVVVDYKTNLLRDPASPGIEALVHGYRPDRLAAAMMDAHYPLQALLYSAALHRYLRWRMPGYDPQTHLGGVLYLFVRGMAGPDTPDGCGVFSWQPSPGMIMALSDLLDGVGHE